MTLIGLLVSEYWLRTDVAYLRYYSGVYTEGLIKTTANFLFIFY
jgi:hypothetical protein